MKKIFISLSFVFFAASAFCLECQMDTLFGGFANFTTVKGDSSYNAMDPDYVVRAKTCDYSAKYTAGGGNIGFDVFFNDFPVGVYFRGGFLSVPGVERTVRNSTVNLDNTEFGFNYNFFLGPVYEFDVNKYFSLCAAPALSLTFIEAQYINTNYQSRRATIDSMLGVGFAGDIYAKFRYKYFVAAAGFNAAYYPYASVESADSKLSYNSIKKANSYSLQPYISIGFTFREKTGSTISAAN